MGIHKKKDRIPRQPLRVLGAAEGCCCCRRSSRPSKRWIWRSGSRSSATTRSICRSPAGPTAVGQADFRDTRDADAIFAVVNGVPPDEGVMVELGIAIALGKPTFLFRDDFRRATDSEEYPLNLMLFTGMPRQDWRDYYYTSIEEIGVPDKALARWVRGMTKLTQPGCEVAIEDRVRAEYRRLADMGFEARTARNRNPNDWYTCVVISMLVKPGTQTEIVRTANQVVRVLKWAVEEKHGSYPYPSFHYGYSNVVEHFEHKMHTKWVGKRHTFEDIEPYCATHGSRSYRHYSDTKAPCDEACSYGLRIL